MRWVLMALAAGWSMGGCEKAPSDDAESWSSSDGTESCDDSLQATGQFGLGTATFAINESEGSGFEFSTVHKIDIDRYEAGCISDISITLKQGGRGCNIDLEFSSTGSGNFALNRLTFTADSYCPNFSDDLEGVYATTETLPLSIDGLPRSVDMETGTEASVCIDDIDIQIAALGTVQLDGSGTERPFELTLQIAGDHTSVGSASAECEPSTTDEDDDTGAVADLDADADADEGAVDEYEGDAAGECRDDADNDRDGLFDCDDPGCVGSPDCDGGPGDDGGPPPDEGAGGDYDGGWDGGGEPPDDDWGPGGDGGGPPPDDGGGAPPDDDWGPGGDPGGDPGGVGGGPCSDPGDIEDCNGECYPGVWIGDSYCEDGSWGPDFNCSEFDWDGGDCSAPSGPGSCDSDDDCEDRCFDEGYDCVCDPAVAACVPGCDSAGECPAPFVCDTSGVSASGRTGICTPGGGDGPPGGP